jgi:DNA-binding MarR family transcriptional regulator
MKQQDEQPPVLALVRLGGLLRRAFTDHLANASWATEAGIRPGCFSVLRSVASAASAPSQRQLCDELGIDPSDMVGLVDVLEQAGYVARDRDPADRRRHALSVTDAGSAALDRFDVLAAAVGDELLGCLEAVEREQLELLLAKVVAQHE